MELQVDMEENSAQGDDNAARVNKVHKDLIKNVHILIDCHQESEEARAGACTTARRLAEINESCMIADEHSPKRHCTASSSASPLSGTSC